MSDVNEPVRGFRGCETHGKLGDGWDAEEDVFLVPECHECGQPITIHYFIADGTEVFLKDEV